MVRSAQVTRVGSYRVYWLESLLYSSRHMVSWVPILMVWKVGRVVGTHRQNSAGFRWSGMAAKRRGLQHGC